MNIPDSYRILVTGVTSIHGWPIFAKLQELLPAKQLFGIRPPKMNIPDIDNVLSCCITDKTNLEIIKKDFNPSHVIHCAGVCDLDVCEERPEWAHEINVNGAKRVVNVFGGSAYIMYMSSDLVFSGNNTPLGGYNESDQLDPVSVVGKTFVLAEEQIRRCVESCVVRLSLPLGSSINGQKGAIDWINKRFKRNLPVTLFYDEYRSCANCLDIGNMAVVALAAKLRGLFHYGGNKRWSLYDIGEHVLKLGGYSPLLLKGRMRHAEVNGPPRVGDVSLDSRKLRERLSLVTVT